METAENLRAPPKTVIRKRSREDKENEQPPLNTPSKWKNHVVVTAEEYDAGVQFLQEKCAKEKPNWLL